MLNRAATWKARRPASASPTRALFATVTTDASCGAINGWHDSFTPLGGMVPLVNIMLSEVIFGGVGVGMYGILIYIVLAVFIAGLMVGRTPEYLGKKIEAYDVKMAMLVSLVFPLIILSLDWHFGGQRFRHCGDLRIPGPTASARFSTLSHRPPETMDPPSRDSARSTRRGMTRPRASLR